MQIHDKYTLPVLDMNSEGIGICKQDGMVIFVPGTVTGDMIELEITEQQKNYATAVLKKIQTPSEHRRTPDCPHSKSCGGCSLGHVTREMELSVKENTVRQAMRRAGVLPEDSVFRPIRTTESYGYRNKVVFHIQNRQIGYYADKTHSLLPGTENCLLLAEDMKHIAAYTGEWLSKTPTVDKHQPESLYIRRTTGGNCTVTIQTAGSYDKAVAKLLNDWATGLMAAFPGIVTGVLHSDHPKGKYAVPTYTLLAGERYLTESWNGIKMRISPEGFCQVNHMGAAILAVTVVSFAKTIAERATTPITAADMYCGSGFFALHLAKAFPDWRIWGMEISAASIGDAKVNAALNGTENLTFFCGDAAALPGRMGVQPDFVVIDPPRAGCSRKLCRELTEMAPSAVAYVSCNPQTLSRDLVWFREGGYVVDVVQPVDMFPGTSHVETVCLLSKLKTDKHIEIDLDMSELDLTASESKATYQEIEEYVLAQTGLKVKPLYVAQVKRKYGIIERENYNKPKSENPKVPQCPPDKEAAIVDALRHFGRI